MRSFRSSALHRSKKLLSENSLHHAPLGLVKTISQKISLTYSPAVNRFRTLLH